MRLLRSDADLRDIPLPLRQEVADCLARWLDCGLADDPSIDLIALVDAGDTIDSVAGYLGLVAGAHDEDFVPPCEWTTDRGCCYEMFVGLSGDAGVSIILPKQPGIDPQLLELFAAYVS